PHLVAGRDGAKRLGLRRGAEKKQPSAGHQGRAEGALVLRSRIVAVDQNVRGLESRQREPQRLGRARELRTKSGELCGGADESSSERIRRKDQRRCGATAVSWFV